MVGFPKGIKLMINGGTPNFRKPPHSGSKNGIMTSTSF